MMIAWVWLRLEVRRRWRSLVVLALLVALACGTVTGAVAGARRGAGAVDRLAARTLPATVIAHTNQDKFDWARIRTLPEVAAVSTFPAYSGFAVEGVPGDPVGAYVPADPVAMRDVERPVVLRGRLPDPARADEVTVTQGFVDRFGRGVGDVLTLRLFSAREVDTGVSAVHVDPPPRPTGPVVRARIVGVVRSPWFSDVVGAPGRVFPSPGLFAAHRTSMIGTPRNTYELWALVRLHRGDADVPGFRAHLAQIAGRTDVSVEPTSEGIRHSRSLARLESVYLLAFAAVALLAAVVLVGQAINRHAAATVADLAVLRPLGLTRGQETVVVAVGPAIAAVAGTVLGLAGAVLVSRWMPFGAAATLEPDPGIDVDVAVLAAGGLLAVAAVAGAAAGTAWLRRAGPSRPPTRRSAVAVSAGRVGLPVPIQVGTRLALDPGAIRGTTRSALVASVAGVLGMAAALTLSAAVWDASTNGARYGQVQHVETGFGYNGMNLLELPVATVAAVARADHDVTASLDVPFAVAEAGRRSVITFGYGEDGPWPGMVLQRGDEPRSGSDVVLGPVAARRLDADVGSTVELTGQSGERGDVRVRRLRVTGIGFVPQTDYNDYDDGAWVTPEGYRTLFGDYFLNHEFLLALRRGADGDAAAGRFRDALVRAGGAQPFVSLPQLPRRMLELRDVRGLPMALGAFVAVLACGATAHALTTTLRRRRADLAVLRAVGLTPRQSRAVVSTHATVLAVVGILIGIPLGVAAGRLVWLAVAQSTPLEFAPPMVVPALASLAVAVLLVFNAVAAPAGRQVARMGIAATLRAE
jgi:hypothetical protein